MHGRNGRAVVDSHIGEAVGELDDKRLVLGRVGFAQLETTPVSLARQRNKAGEAAESIKPFGAAALK